MGQFGDCLPLIPIRLAGRPSARFAAAILGCGTAILLAQPPATSGSSGAAVTFRAGTEEVLVDAAVADKKGNFQRDLAQEDFKILEDGKEQKITSFALGNAGGRSKHFIALVFDNEYPGLREEVMRFVDRVASPDLYIAVFSRANRGELLLRQAFTTDAGRVRAVLGAMEVSPYAPIPGSGKAAIDHVPVAGLLVLRPLVEEPILDRVVGVAQSLAPIRGKKALILFSAARIVTRSAPTVLPTGGAIRPALQIALTRVATIEKAFDDCNAAGVSVYSFENGKNAGASVGDFYHPPEDIAQDRGAATDLIRDLAVFTGGRYTPPGDYDLTSYLTSITAEQSDYYLLGYAPPADSAGKPCHKIKVKVDRSGLDVTARDSYCISGEPAARALKPAQRALEARGASGVAGNLGVGLQLSWFYLKPGVPVVDIAADIEPHVFKMPGKTHGEFNLLQRAYREDGSVAAEAGDTIKLDFDTPAELDEFLKVPYHYSNQFRLAPGSYRFRLTVGSGGEAFGNAEAPLDIAPWTGQTLSMSGIALSTQALRLTDVTAELDSSLLEGPHQLRSKGLSIVPMGGAKFNSGQSGVFYVEIYEPQAPAADHGQPNPSPTMQIRVLDRATGQEKLDSGPIITSNWMRPGEALIPIALDLPVSKLPPGSYTLEMLGARGSDAVVRSANFDVK
jgi:VWFA-related protein